jgi:hypothetical protein
VPIVLKSGSLNLLEPSGHVNGIALPLPLLVLSVLPPSDNLIAVNNNNNNNKNKNNTVFLMHLWSV